MKNFRTSNPNRLDNLLCLLIVAVGVGSAGYAAIALFSGSMSV
jgi:hypothetical protein